MTEWVHWATATALLLPRLLADRHWGPVFLASRKPARAVATADLCPVTGRARLSYRRAAEVFEISTRHLAHPDATAAELAGLHGWQISTSSGTRCSSTKPRTAPPRPPCSPAPGTPPSLERYARPAPKPLPATSPLPTPQHVGGWPRPAAGKS